ncbi:DUF397 domain-containing protein [Solwaraspora sp. WMMD791]|uniref:DUF397 domain-containing protein n=1 Tax=unclassified Solwaraspora TaxID=2627926 RepID=UPI00249A0DB5|nr:MULTISPECIES: DUF397 domain-containing protein [unclassified Solwaraspora]WFE26832.1 DUF397 domain-containing protein [Solwaraspora sp. WMMD791]WJK40509.1 DUF397 domain-containing protein [Solwaraspora sp. WMMA2056]
MNPADQSVVRIVGGASPTWRTSSRSQSTNCVEVGELAGRSTPVLMRDSKDRSGPVLSFDRTTWREFIDSAKDGEFDLS